MERDLARQLEMLQYEVVKCNEMNPGERVRKILEIEKARVSYIRAHERTRDVISYVQSELKIYK